MVRYKKYELNYNKYKKTNQNLQIDNVKKKTNDLPDYENYIINNLIKCSNNNRIEISQNFSTKDDTCLFT